MVITNYHGFTAFINYRDLLHFNPSYVKTVTCTLKFLNDLQYKYIIVKINNLITVVIAGTCIKCIIINFSICKFSNNCKTLVIN